MIILASQSPRRKEILKEILDDVPFVCIPSSFDERKVHEDDVKKLCLEEARGKGLAVAKDHQDDIVISSDTMVSFKGEQLGKPKDHDDALRMLRELSGETHEIVTAYSIFKGEKELCHRVVVAKLYIEKMADAEIEMYLDTGSPYDKAGAYGVQDKDFIYSKILQGDMYTIMGLPKYELEDDLVELGIIE
jgi:septum formation protein